LDLGLEGRTAIVCGASAGMGLATAEALAREGANVSMFARSQVGRSYTSDPSADHAHVRRDILRKRCR